MLGSPEKNGLVSIVVPAYNHGQYIDRCIDSIIAQSYTNIELIIVNDGSPDNTAERILARAAECKARFSRFIFIDKQNEGQIKTFNRGCFKATGQYLSICASDDAYTPDAIETLVSFLNENPDYILAVGDNYIMDAQDQTCFWDAQRNIVTNKSTAKYHTFGDFLQSERRKINFNSAEFGSYSSLLNGNYIPNGYVFRRDIFIDTIGGYSEAATLEDFYLHLQLSKHGKYKWINQPLFYYRWHSGNTVRQTDKMVEANTQTFLLERDYAHSHGFTEQFSKSPWLSIDTIQKIPYIYSLEKCQFQSSKRLTLRVFGLKIFEKIKKPPYKTVELFTFKCTFTF